MFEIERGRGCFGRRRVPRHLLLDGECSDRHKLGPGQLLLAVLVGAAVTALLGGVYLQSRTELVREPANLTQITCLPPVAGPPLQL